MRPTSPPLRLIVRHRRLLAALLAATALWCATLAVRPQPTTAVLAAAHDLGSGPLTTGDLTTVNLPTTTIPDGAIRPGTDVTGRLLAAPLRRGEPITDIRLLGPTLVDAYGPGMRATPVRIHDPATASLLHPGDTVDVIGTTTQWDDTSAPASPTVIRSLKVIATPKPPTDQLTDAGTLIVLVTTPDQATTLAHAATTSRLSVTIHGRAG
ncbi:SAF domain-containing protein [Sphaerisporangium rubeum]|uniref:Flp pilus assembly protein CpaB n=1 Tax=Sphaerisporangium rubeum TaxID=321317 RepID=A0A7X0M921_9ACTN|nr:Flp pilus assembly protein CpaB [Sphaerisporangium rubeum]MBB6476448.1 Flp pilus assembly protein CpaB [Sphaerisporangium rubeum]